MATEARYYGISTGDGNNGVSHMFADYYVKTNEPYRLAELAALSEFKAGEGRTWAKENMQIEGEADYTISVAFYESKETQDERDEMNERSEALQKRIEDCEDDAERAELESEAEELDSEIEGFGCDSAWFIVEIFPEDEMREGRPTYESLEDCFGAELVASVEPELV